MWWSSRQKQLEDEYSYVAFMLDVRKVAVLPPGLKQKSQCSDLEITSVVLTKLTKAQAEYLSVSADSPYRPEHYPYKAN